MPVATQTKTSKKKKMMRFKLLRGRHREGHTRVIDRKTGQEIRSNTIKNYSAFRRVQIEDPDTGEVSVVMKPCDGYDEDSDIIDSTSDLTRRFGARKFQRLPDPPQDGQEESEEEYTALDNMKTKELRTYAEEAEIDLETATTKSEILNTIKAALEAA